MIIIIIIINKIMIISSSIQINKMIIIIMIIIMIISSSIQINKMIIIIMINKIMMIQPNYDDVNKQGSFIYLNCFILFFDSE